MGTSLVVARKKVGNGHQFVLPSSFPVSTSVTDSDGKTITPPGGATAGNAVAYVVAAQNNSDAQCPHIVAPVTLPGRIAIFNNNLKATAHTATVLLNPLTADMSLINPVKLGPASRVAFAARVQTAATSITNPVIVPFLVWGEYDSDNKRWYGVEWVERLDADSVADAGLTLTFDTTPASSDSLTMADGWYVTPPEATRDGYDTRGAPYLLVLHSTAGVADNSALMHGIVRITN